MRFGNSVRVIRQSIHPRVTQQMVAERVGVSTSTISRIETEQIRNVPDSLKWKIAEALAHYTDSDPQDLFWKLWFQMPSPPKTA